MPESAELQELHVASLVAISQELTSLGVRHKLVKDPYSPSISGLPGVRIHSDTLRGRDYLIRFTLVRNGGEDSYAVGLDGVPPTKTIAQAIVGAIKTNRLDAKKLREKNKQWRQSFDLVESLLVRFGICKESDMITPTYSGKHIQFELSKELTEDQAMAVLSALKRTGVAL